VLAFLEIARAAFLSLARRLGPWLLALAVLTVAGWNYAQFATRPLLEVGTAVWVSMVFPAVTGMGLRRSVHRGPMGLVAGGRGYLATVGYGLGAALVVAPFAGLAAWTVCASGPREMLIFGGSTVAVVFAAAWLGAASGRLVESGLAVVLLSWFAAALIFAVTIGLATLVELAQLAKAFEPKLSRAEVLDVVIALSALGLTHLVLFAASRVDGRSPAALGP
jgi:hypothetical protein